MHLVYNEQTGDFEEKLYIHPPKVSFKMTNRGNSVFKGDKVHLVWTLEDAEKVTLDGEEMTDQIFSQDIQCDNTGLRDFVLVASNPIGETKQILSVSIIDKPTFDIHCSRPKLRRGKNETCELRWNVRFAHSISLITPEGKIEIASSGSKILSPTETEVLKFEALAIDNTTIFTEEITIGVYDESIVQFKANRTYSFPQLPIVLAWDVTNAQSIELEGFGEQPAEGSIIVEPRRTTTYRLLVKDEFGEKAYEEMIQMLPLPFIKTLMAPLPNFVSNMAVTIQQPRYNVDLKFPQIDIGWINMEIPKNKSLTEEGLFRKLLPPLPEVNFNIMSSIKKVFNQIIRK